MKTDTLGGLPVEYAENIDDLAAIYEPPSELAVRKCLTQLDGHCRAFIARSPFLCISTTGMAGSADVSPRGDAPGFVHVLDDETLLIPDRPGNNRIDTLSNLMRNPHVGLLFLVPGIDETLRVNGTARVVMRSELLTQLTANNKAPKSAIVVSVREAYLQCAKALVRSKLWSHDYRVDRTALPTLGKILIDQTKLSMPVADLDAAIDKAYREKLY